MSFAYCGFSASTLSEKQSWCNQETPGGAGITEDLSEY